ncbi:hypothetical protein [Neobacillus sp. D3-1R]|uniref:hypothetical protein n=1 Tax=Neobacillus sp. D3-1R TaxID=3445778 RepID=UPI003F9F3C50
MIILYYLLPILLVSFPTTWNRDPLFIGWQILKVLIGIGYVFLITYVGLVDLSISAVFSYFAWFLGLAWIADSFVTSYLTKSNAIIYQGLAGFIIFLISLYMVLIYPINLANDKYNVVDGKKVETILAETDEKNIPSVPLVYAEYKAEKLMGELDNSSFYNLGVFSIQKIGQELFWVTPIEFEDYSTWKKADKVAPGYILVNALDETAPAKLVQTDMKYVPSAYFSNNLERIIRKQYPKLILMEASFEPDDQGKPYYAVTYGSYQKYRHIPKVQGIILFDPVTGKLKDYKTNDIPTFVDQLIPADDIASVYNDWYGKYGNGWLNSWWGKKGVIVPTDWGMESEVAPVYNSKGEMSWFTDFTTLNGGSSMVGYSLINARTGDFTFYTGENAKGLITGDSAIRAVNKTYTVNKWKGTQPMLYNIYGEMTWFIPVVDSDGLLRAYALVNAKDATIIGTAATKKEAFAAYKTAVVTKKASGNVVPGENLGLKELTGIMDAKEVVTIDKDVYVYFTLKGQNQLFKVAMTKFPFSIVAKEGDKVMIKVIETDEQIVEVQDFLNQTANR